VLGDGRADAAEVAAGIDERPRRVASHHRSVQFCWKGVTGTMTARTGGIAILEANGPGSADRDSASGPD
jgi:hypothetical protein